MSEEHKRLLMEALRLVVARCPGLVRSCYWAGTSAISLEELDHRDSFDLDFHTLDALADVRPLLAEMQAAFADDLEVLQAPAGLGRGFSGVLKLASGEHVTIEILSNYEDVEASELVTSSTAPPMQRISATRYLADKIQCVAERAEARDLVDLMALLRQRPRLQSRARALLAQQDALIVAERLLGWTDQAVREDLEAYPDVDPGDALQARDLLLGWLKASEGEDEEPVG